MAEMIHDCHSRTVLLPVLPLLPAPWTSHGLGATIFIQWQIEIGFSRTVSSPPYSLPIIRRLGLIQDKHLLVTATVDKCAR